MQIAASPNSPSSKKAAVKSPRVALRPSGRAGKKVQRKLQHTRAH